VASLLAVDALGVGAVRPSDHADIRRPEDDRWAAGVPSIGGHSTGLRPDRTTFPVFAAGGPGRDTPVGPPVVEQEWRLGGLNCGQRNGNIRFVSFESLVRGDFGETLGFLPGS
jgi:hypothetical protein